MTYEVELWTPCKKERGLERTELRVVGTLKAAELLSKEWLKPHARCETRSQYRRAFAYTNVYQRGKRKAKIGPVASHNPTLTIVPSVGELGYW
jgi:hypothetical protein